VVGASFKPSGGRKIDRSTASITVYHNFYSSWRGTIKTTTLYYTRKELFVFESIDSSIVANVFNGIDYFSRFADQ
jgi:hypothetical protein